MKLFGNSLASPVVRTQHSYCCGWVQSVVGELRWHKLGGEVKKRKGKRIKLSIEELKVSELPKNRKKNQKMIRIPMSE